MGLKSFGATTGSRRLVNRIVVVGGGMAGGNAARTLRQEGYDGDVLLIKARQIGGACHEGYRSCFFRRVGGTGQLEITAPLIFDASSVYGSAK